MDFPGLPFINILEVGIERVAGGLIAGGEPDRRTLKLDTKFPASSTGFVSTPGPQVRLAQIPDSAGQAPGNRLLCTSDGQA